jgi:hypothetical protein
MVISSLTTQTDGLDESSEKTAHLGSTLHLSRAGERKSDVQGI